MSVAGSLRITYVRSGIGHPRDQKETVRALGLREGSPEFANALRAWRAACEGGR